MGEQDTFTQQTLISCRELNFGDGKRMTQVQGPIHIRVGEVPKPLGKLVMDLCTCEACGFLTRWGIGFEDMLPFPLLLVSFFQGFQVIPLSGLPIERIISNRADDAKGEKHLCKFDDV